jgi:23S rRNA (adenine2503-C2)-methyltransferase
MKWIYNLSFEQLNDELASLGFKTFAARQIFQWLYEKNIQDTAQWTDIGKAHRQLLASHYDTQLPPVPRVDRDSEGTAKFLIQLHDRLKIEAVSIPEKHHYTFCISTQAGCPLNCAFCATGRTGFKRNLAPGEILSQILILRKAIQPYKGKLNLVFMGMGEPLLNYPNLKQALQIITPEQGMSISPRNITLSTSGILEPLKQLETDFPKIKISFSLNAPDPVLRERLMPISKKEKLQHLLQYFKRTGKNRIHRVTFEYVLLKGVNDSQRDAANVSELLKGIPCKINLIPYNKNEGLPFEPPTAEQVEAFGDYLHSRGYTVIIRWSKGSGIKSACGQLAADDRTG